MNIPWKIVKRTYTPADEMLEKIKNIMFPPLELETEQTKHDNVIKFHVDYSIDSNLYAALTDLLDGNNDEITRGTIEKSIDKLTSIRRMLEAYAIIDEEAAYVIVDNDRPGTSSNIEDIKSIDD